MRVSAVKSVQRGHEGVKAVPHINSHNNNSTHVNIDNDDIERDRRP